MITTDVAHLNRFPRVRPSHNARQAQRPVAQDATACSTDVSARSEERVAGKVFALKDGSGYATQGSDGRYYRLKTSLGNGVATAVSSRSIEAALVDVVAGAVTRLR
jgi:hypothetical protein